MYFSLTELLTTDLVHPKFRITTNNKVYRIEKSYFGIFWNNAHWRIGNTFHSLKAAEEGLTQLVNEAKEEWETKGKFLTIKTVTLV